MSRLADCFAASRAAGRALLVGYLPAGFPSYAESLAAFDCLVANGVDVVEVGLPYSDPLMDGAVIQRAVEQALAGGTRSRDVLRVVEHVAAGGTPAVVMSYWNPIEQYGAATFAADVASAGGVGVITPDLLPDAAVHWLAAMDDAGIDPVFLAAPSSTDARLRVVAGHSRGFVYAASTMGVTGARVAVSGQAVELVSRLRALTELPVAVGLGVSTGAQAAEVAGFADGVIVGSALVDTLLRGTSEANGRAALGLLIADMAGALGRARRVSPVAARYEGA